MQLINDTLAELVLAAPQNYANLAVYPLIAPPAAAGAQQKITIPVSCVEHGRWRYNSAEFACADRLLRQVIERDFEIA